MVLQYGQIWPALMEEKISLTSFLQGDWQNQDPALKAPIQAHIHDGLVSIEGALSKPTKVGGSGAQTIAILPPKLRPKLITSTGLFNAIQGSSNRNNIRFQVYPDGRLNVNNLNNNAVVSQLYVVFVYDLDND